MQSTSSGMPTCMDAPGSRDHEHIPYEGCLSSFWLTLVMFHLHTKFEVPICSEDIAVVSSENGCCTNGAQN